MVHPLRSLAGKVESSASVPQSFRGVFDSAAKATGADVGLLSAIAKAESNYNASAKSPAGAIGLMQLMPATAKGLGVNPNDPAQNVLGGAKYISQMMKKFGSTELALAAYNAGPGNVQKAIQQAGSRDWNKIKQYLPKETQNYVPKVIANMG
jgi:soluble lytic murein transglycosylase-like protein